MSLPNLTLSNRKERIAVLSLALGFVLWATLYEAREMKKAEYLRKIELHTKKIAHHLDEQNGASPPRHESYPDVEFVHDGGVVRALHTPTGFTVEAETRFDALLALVELVEENTTMGEDGVPHTSGPEETASSDGDDEENYEESGEETEGEQEAA